MANQFIGRSPDGGFYRSTTVNTTKLATDTAQAKEQQRTLLSDHQLICQVCYNKQAELDGRPTIPFLKAPDRSDLFDEREVPLLHVERLDLNQYGSLAQCWDDYHSKIGVHFRANQSHQETSVGHRKRYVGRSLDVNETAQAIIKERSAVGQFIYSYQLIQTDYLRRPIIFIQARAEDGTLVKRFYVYEAAFGYAYYQAVRSVIQQYAKDDGVQDVVILSVVKTSEATYAGKLMIDFKYNDLNIRFLQRQLNEFKQVEYTVLSAGDAEAVGDERIGGGASEDTSCSSADADERLATTGVRQFASTTERTNYYSSQSKQKNISALLTEMQLMNDDMLEVISSGAHSYYGKPHECILAGNVLEERRITHDERLLSLAVTQLRQYQTTDSNSVRQIGEDAPFLRKVADTAMWQQPSEQYERLGLESYLKHERELTFASLAVAQGRIEDITRLLTHTMEELQSSRFSGLHYSIKHLGQYLCSKLVVDTIEPSVVVDY